MPMRPCLAAIVLMGSMPCQAELDDFVSLTAEETEALNDKVGTEADIIWVHKDLKRQDSAPLIQLKLFSIDEDPQLVGSYQAVRQTLLGMGEMEKVLQTQYWIAQQNDPALIATTRTDLIEVNDEAASIFIGGYFMDVDGGIFQQFQYMAWAKDESRKCVIASEVEDRLAAYYEDSVIDAMAELAALCHLGMNFTAFASAAEVGS